MIPAACAEEIGMNRGRKWIVFFLAGKEILRYTMEGEGQEERQETIKLLTYERGVSPSEIYFAEITSK